MTFGVIIKLIACWVGVSLMADAGDQAFVRKDYASFAVDLTCALLGTVAVMAWLGQIINWW